MFKSFLTIQELHLCDFSGIFMSSQLPHRSPVSGSAAIKPPLTVFMGVFITSLFVCFLSSRNGSNYVTQSGDRPRVFRLILDQCWTEEGPPGRLDLCADSPGWTDPTSSSPLLVSFSLFCIYEAVLTWNVKVFVCCCQYNRHVYRNKHIVIIS